MICCQLTLFWQLKGHTYMDQLDYMYMYMKTTRRLQCAIFIVTCQPEASKMYAPPSRLIYPITHSTVRLTCDSSILICSNEQQHMYHVYLSPPRNELDQETDIDTRSQLTDTCSTACTHPFHRWVIMFAVQCNNSLSVTNLIIN